MDPLTLRVGSSNGISDLMQLVIRAAAAELRLTIENFWTNTANHTLYARRVRWPVRFFPRRHHDDKHGQCRAPFPTLQPNKRSRPGPEQHHGDGRDGNGRRLQRHGPIPDKQGLAHHLPTPAGSQAMNGSTPGFSQTRKYCYTVQYRGRLQHTHGTVSSQSCSFTANSAPTLTSVTATPACLKTGLSRVSTL